MSSAEIYRRRAQACQHLAEEAAHPEIKDRLQQLAWSWELLADQSKSNGQWDTEKRRPFQL
jgi:hypothetical protein